MGVEDLVAELADEGHGIQELVLKVARVEVEAESGSLADRPSVLRVVTKSYAISVCLCVEVLATPKDGPRPTAPRGRPRLARPRCPPFHRLAATRAPAGTPSYSLG
jgi:hypothetical protein